MRNVVSQLNSAGPLRTMDGMIALQQHAFTQLLAAWRRRDGARHGGDHREQAEARIQLDSARAASRSMLDPLR